MELIDISVPQDQVFAENSGFFSVVPGETYRAVAKGIVTAGKACSGYFALVVLDGAEREVLRRVRWLDDRSNAVVDYPLVVRMPEGAAKAVLGFRVNTEIAIESNWQGRLCPIGEVELKLAAGETEVFDDLLAAHTARAEEHVGALTEEEEKRLEENLVWLFGSGRSGSSWLFGQLLRGDGVIYWNEPLLGHHLGIVASGWSFLGDDYDRNTFIFPIPRAVEVFSDEPDYFFSRPYEAVWRTYLRKMILHRIYAQHPNALDNIVVVKEPNGSMAADVIMKVLPQSKLMFLLRDGRDVADSKMAAHRKTSWANKWVRLPAANEKNRKLILITVSNVWRRLTEIVETAYEAHDPEKRLFLRYEDLRKNTVNELQRVCAFLGLPITDEEAQARVDRYSFERLPDSAKGEGRVTRRAKPGGWRESFRDEEQAILKKIMGPTLTKYGYPH